MQERAATIAPASGNSSKEQSALRARMEALQEREWGAQPIQNTEKIVVRRTVMVLLPGLRLPVVIMPRM